MTDFSTSPADSWIASAPSRSLRAEALRGHVRVRLYEAGVKVGEGWGHSIAGAVGEALGDVMRRQHDAEERRSA